MEFEFSSYYSRHFPLNSIGKDGQKLLAKRHVLVAGVGGLGTISSDLLAGLGIGKLTIADFDVVEQSNLPRQPLYTFNDMGMAKVDVAAKRLSERNPSIEINPVAIRLDGLSVKELLDDVDLVVDGLDRFSSRQSLHFHAMKLKIPYLFAGAVGEQANISTFMFQENDPCMNCVFGMANDDPNRTCEFMGIHPSILHIAAGIQVSEAVRILTEKKPLLQSKLMIVDLDDLDFSILSLNKNPICPTCSNEQEEKGNIGERKKFMFEIPGKGTAKVTSICGRSTYIIEPQWEINPDFSIIEENYKTIKKSENVITFVYRNANVSILKSGLSTLRGPDSIELAKTIAKKIYGNI